MSKCEYGQHRGNSTWELLDARGIYCARVCEYCETEQERKYRPEIFTNANYAADEPIEPEEY